MTASLLVFAMVLAADPVAPAPLPPDDGGTPSVKVPGGETAPLPVQPTVKVPGGETAPLPIEAPPPAPEPAPKRGVSIRGALEALISSFPSGPPGGAQDVFLGVTPLFAIDAGDDFAVEVGADFRLRVFDDPPLQRAGDIGGVLRKEDWDEASDFGQIIRSFRLGRREGVVWAQLGAVRKKTLGLGHLISRYSNQDNPDYHPASAELGFAYKAIRAELFASDLFGARLFAGEVSADLGRIIGSSESSQDRFHLAFSAAHDAGQAGGSSPQASLLQLDFDAVLYRAGSTRIMAETGLGSRLQLGSDLGAELGLSVDSNLDSLVIGGKLEGRKQAGGFRQGFFGAGYELSRFSGVGFTQPPQASEKLPDSFSFYGELHLAIAGVSFDTALEHYLWGRTDADLLFSLDLLEHHLLLGSRFTAVGLGTPTPRYAFSGEARVRLFSSFYVLASGGTVFFPQPDNTLSRGVFAGAGAGVDFER